MAHTSIFLPIGSLNAVSNALYSVFSAGLTMYLETSPDFWTHLSLQIEPENRTVQTYQEASAYFHAIAQEFSDKAEAMAEEGIDRREEAGKPDAE